MTTTMGYESSLSASMSRSHISKDAPSMADQLPSVDFNFEDLRTRMAQFTARFDRFIEDGRKRVLEEKNHFRINLAELQEDQKQATRSVEIETMKAQSHSMQLQKENAEKAEMHTHISSLTTHRDTLSAQNSTLHTELKSLQSTLVARKDAQAKHARYLSSQSRHNIPELGFWEDYLCMRIEGAGVEDRLRFVFTHVIEKDWEREGWFELDTSTRDYRVTKSVPKLDEGEVDTLVEAMNESRELGPFFKGMRECFVRALK